MDEHNEVSGELSASADAGSGGPPAAPRARPRRAPHPRYSSIATFGIVIWLVSLALGCHGDSGEAPLRVAHQRLLLAPVDVSGVEGWFLLDTGSSGSVVSPALASKLERSSKSHQVSGFGNANKPVDVERVKTGNIRFAKGRLKYPEEMSVLDLGFLKDWAGERVDGILGWDVLREYVWGIDVRGRRLVASRRLSPQEVLSSFGMPHADATLQLAIMGDLPCVTAQSQGKPLQLLLDTGAERTVLAAEGWRRLGLEPLPGEATVVIRGVNGDNTGRKARLAELSLGPVAWTGIEVMLTDAASSSDQDGLLGMDLISEYVIVVDGPSRTLYLAKRRAARE